MARDIDGLNEYGRLRSVVLKHPRHAFGDDTRIGAEWRRLNFSGPPDLDEAFVEYERFADLIGATGAEIIWLEASAGTTLDSIYARDAVVLAPVGLVECRMGKSARASEPRAQVEALTAAGWRSAGAIVSPGTLEGGDVIWLDGQTVVVGQGARTNAEGIRQYRRLVGEEVELIVVPLPDAGGPHDVLHLMSLISPVDRDLAVVYPRLLPEAFQRRLRDRGMTCVAVPDDEYEPMGTNVLAIGPRDCVMLDGLPQTRAALERAGCRVRVYEGHEISLKGGGGPTCLTRPLARDGII